VSYRWKPIVACLSLLLVAAAGGCGQSGDGKQSPSAAIDAGKGGSTSDAGSTTPAPAKPTSDSHPVVEIETSLGKVTVELDRDKAKLTVDNFLRYVGEGFYDQTIVHQVYKDQGILAGGYGADLLPVAKPLHASVRNEADNGLKNLQGTIAMFRSQGDVHGAKSQFFINVANNPGLDYKDRNTPQAYGYCVFGKVIGGMDVVDKINNVPLRDVPLERTPAEKVIVTTIRRIK
jgi:cyclophilin family peptidyl-prolyl cis-trans isomerase